MLNVVLVYIVVLVKVVLFLEVGGSLFFAVMLMQCCSAGGYLHFYGHLVGL